MAEGVIGSLEEIRSVIKASEDIRRFEPQKLDERWGKRYTGTIGKISGIGDWRMLC